MILLIGESAPPSGGDQQSFNNSRSYPDRDRGGDRDNGRGGSGGGSSFRDSRGGGGRDVDFGNFGGRSRRQENGRDYRYQNSERDPPPASAGNDRWQDMPKNDRWQDNRSDQRGSSGGGGGGGRWNNDRESGGRGGRGEIDWTIPTARDERVELDLFGTGSTGINFSKYEDIPVEASGDNIPAHISSVSSIILLFLTE